MKNLIELLLLSALLLLVGCESETTGTVQGEDTGIATLVNELGNPVPNASVRVFKYRDSTGIYEDSVSTNAVGEYSFNQKLPTGRYTIWAETDTTVMYREDLLVVPDSLFEDEDTLKPARKIWVPVKVQPNHNPQTVEAQIWGTPIRHNVTANGFLVLDKITAGSYFTRLTTTLDGYTPTNDTIVITALSPDTLLDTLELIYTGIPVVEGVKTEYDTLSGIANVSWAESPFSDLDAYLVYRDPVNSIQLSKDPIGVTADTFFLDSLGDMGKEKENYEYRIKIRSSDDKVGSSFYKDTVKYLNPDSIFGLFDKDLDTFYVHYENQVRIKVSDWFGELDSIKWEFDGQSYKQGRDKEEISYVVENRYVDSMFCRVEIYGQNERTCVDSFWYSSTSKFEKITNPFAEYSQVESATVHNNKIFTVCKSRNKNELVLLNSSNGVDWDSVSAWIFEGGVNNQYVNSELVSYNDSLWFVSPSGNLDRSLNGVEWQSKSIPDLDSVNSVGLSVVSAGIVVYYREGYSYDAFDFYLYKNGDWKGKLEYPISLSPEHGMWPTQFIEIDNCNYFITSRESEKWLHKLDADLAYEEGNSINMGSFILDEAICKAYGRLLGLSYKIIVNIDIPKSGGASMDVLYYIDSPSSFILFKEEQLYLIDDNGVWTDKPID